MLLATPALAQQVQELPPDPEKLVQVLGNRLTEQMNRAILFEARVAALQAENAKLKDELAKLKPKEDPSK